MISYLYSCDERHSDLCLYTECSYTVFFGALSGRGERLFGALHRWKDFRSVCENKGGNFICGYVLSLYILMWLLRMTGGMIS